jgi:aspartate-semialdehyde dehydrogenase
MVNLAIIGATGAVGIEAIKILNDTDIQYDNLKLFASKSSVGKKYVIRHKDYYIEEVKETSFNNIDYAILAVSEDLSRQYILWSKKNKSKCVFIDNSCAFRMDKNVPLIIPEINFDSYKNENVIANPNCSTIIMLMVLAPLHKKNQIKQIDLSTYQAASGGGLPAMQELIEQTHSYVKNEEMQTKIFERQYLFNAFSHDSKLDMETKFNSEEIKIINETKKILNVKENDFFSMENYNINAHILSYLIFATICHMMNIILGYWIENNFILIGIFLAIVFCLLKNNQNLNKMIINPTCIRIPTLRSHMESITVTFKNKTTEDQIKKILEESSGVKIYDHPEINKFPEPLITEHKDEIYVGRIRKSYDGNSRVFQMLVSGDQIRKGAALNALQIYEKILSNK